MNGLGLFHKMLSTDDTIRVMWQKTCYCHARVKNKFSLQMLHIGHICQIIHVNMRQVYQYICLIWNDCNQQCDLKHCYTFHHIGICLWINKYASNITHICPTALLLWSTYRPQITGHIDPPRKLFNYHTTAIYVPTTNMSFKCHICKLVHVQIGDNYVSICASYELNAINNFTRTDIHTFQITGICSWADMPPTLDMYPTKLLL